MPKITFIDTEGTRRDVDAPVGLSVLEIAHKNDIDLEGACEGSLACSTCHVIVEPEWYDLLNDASEDEESGDYAPTVVELTPAQLKELNGGDADSEKNTADSEEEADLDDMDERY